METEQSKSRKKINIELPDKIIEKGKIEQAVKEGYVANYNFIKESSKEWDFSAGDGIWTLS